MNMNKTTLHTLRLIIPGVIIFIFTIAPYLEGWVKIIEIKISLNDIVFFAVVLAVGGFYYIMNPRRYFMKKSLKIIDSNIEDQLLEPFLNDKKIMNSLDCLKQGRKLMNVFYYFIDNEKPLTERAKEVYFNGLVWTTAIDIMIISFVFFVIDFITLIITKDLRFLVISSICFFLFLIAAIIQPKIVDDHIALSNNQLEYIKENCRKELKKKIYSLIK